MNKIVLATTNAGKAREIRKIFDDLPVEFLSLSEFPDAPVVVEDGTTFLENARKKAVEIARFAGLPALGEDSGIEVDALDGRPGIYSARYAGDDRANNRKLVEEMAEVPDGKRTARYRCVIVLSDPQGKELATAEGACEGVIGRQEAGTDGFGYDPLFIVPGYGGRTMAELGLEIKSGISHRARALSALRDRMSELFPSLS